MPLFRRGREPEVPEWASFMSPQEFGEFTATVAAELAALGVAVTWEEGAVVAQLDDGPYTMGLANLAQMAHGVERDDRAELVRSHFRRMLELHADDAREAPAYDDVAALLKIRLWGEADLPPDFPLVKRRVADGLVAVLCVDRPQEVSTVRTDQTEAWPASEDELWELAARNTRADPDMEIETQQPSDPEHLPLVTCVGDSFFSYSRALWPDDLVSAVPPEGLLLAVPNRHLALACAIVDTRVIGMISWLPMFVRDRYVEGPGSISDALYWWHEGEWVRLPVEVQEDQVQFFPPDAFVEALNRLAE